MTKKNKHLLKLLSLSLLPIAAISIPAVVLTSCSSGKEESSDNSNNNQPNNPGNNGGEDNTNPGGDGNTDNPENISNFPTFLSADVAREQIANDIKNSNIDANIPLLINEEDYLKQYPDFVENLKNGGSGISSDIFYSIDDNSLYFLYSTNLENIYDGLKYCPIFIKGINGDDDNGTRFIFNPQRIQLFPIFSQLYKLSDESLKYDDPKVAQLYTNNMDKIGTILARIDLSNNQVQNHPELTFNPSLLPSLDFYCYAYYSANDEFRIFPIPQSTLSEFEKELKTFIWKLRLASQDRFSWDEYTIPNLIQNNWMPYFDSLVNNNFNWKRNAEFNSYPLDLIYNSSSDDYWINMLDYYDQHPNAPTYISDIQYQIEIRDDYVDTCAIKIKSNYRGKKIDPSINIRDAYERMYSDDHFKYTLASKVIIPNNSIRNLELKLFPETQQYYLTDGKATWDDYTVHYIKVGTQNTPANYLSVVGDSSNYKHTIYVPYGPNPNNGKKIDYYPDYLDISCMNPYLLVWTIIYNQPK